MLCVSLCTFLSGMLAPLLSGMLESTLLSGVLGQLRNNERGAALDCFKKAIEVTPAMAARLIQVLKAEVAALEQQHQQHSSCCRV